MNYVTLGFYLMCAVSIVSGERPSVGIRPGIGGDVFGTLGVVLFGKDL